MWIQDLNYKHNELQHITLYPLSNQTTDYKIQINEATRKARTSAAAAGALRATALLSIGAGGIAVTLWAAFTAETSTTMMQIVKTMAILQLFIFQPQQLQEKLANL